MLNITERKQYRAPRYASPESFCRKTTTLSPIGIAATKTEKSRLFPRAPNSRHSVPTITGIISNLTAETRYALYPENSFKTGAAPIVSPSKIIASGLIQLDSFDKTVSKTEGNFRGRSPKTIPATNPTIIGSILNLFLFSSFP